MKKYIVLILLLLSASSMFAQNDFSEIREDFRKQITKTIKKKKIVGASVAVVLSQGVLWIDNFGSSDEETSEPVTEETLFGLGSVTKVFTSTAVMQLTEKGQINLDRPLHEYLPSFQMKDDNAGVTPRNVLTHHSGLPSDIFKGMFSRQPEDYKTVVDYMNQEYMAGSPNQIRAYSNPGYTLLGHMIAEVSKTEYPDYMRSEIFDPLGMKQSRFNGLDQASKTYDKKGKYREDVNLRDIPAGGLFSSTKEMSLFMQAFLNQSEDLLTKETFTKILEQQHKGAVLDYSDRYALGWNMTSRPHAGDIYTHTGTTMYFNAAVAFSPKADIGVIVLTNSENGGHIFHVANSIIEHIAESKNLPIEEKKSIELGSKKRVQRSVAELDQHVGIYAAPGAYINVFRERKKLFMTLQGLRLELIPVADNQFKPKIILLRFIPIRLGDQRIIFEDIGGYRVMNGLEEGSEKELIAQKMESQIIRKNWQTQAGDYEIANALAGEIPFFKDFKLEEKDNL